MWAFGRYQAVPGPGMLALTVTFGLLAVALGYYLAHLKRFLGR